MPVAVEPGCAPGDAQRRAGRGEPALQLGHEQQVGQLGVGVGRIGPVATPGPGQVVEVEVTVPVRRRADDHHPVGEPWQQQVGQREVAEVVGGQVQLDAVGRRAERQREHAGVVDEHVDRPDRLGEGPHRRQVGQVEQSELDVAGHLLGRGAAPVEVADRQDDQAPRVGQDLGGLEADPSAGAGDDEPAAVLARYVVPALSRHARRVPAKSSSRSTPPPRRRPRDRGPGRDVPDLVAQRHRPADRAQPVLDLLDRARQDLAGRVAALALRERHVEGHRELDHVVAAARRGPCGPRRGRGRSRTAPACRRCGRGRPHRSRPARRAAARRA